LSADTPKALTFSVTLARNKNADLRVVGNELQLFGALNDGHGGTGMRYLARVRIQHTGGVLAAVGTQLTLTGADDAIIYFSAATDFRGIAYEQQSTQLLENALATPYEKQKACHISTFQQLFNRVSLYLSGP